MPAPNRRNKGEALAHQINHHASPRQQDDRDSLAATRARAAKKWDEAAARLSPALSRAAEQGSTLAERADEARRDHARGRQFERFDTDVRMGRAKPPVVVLAPAAPPRYYLGGCLDCERELWVHTAKPRVPLCARCREKR